ncbi:MAG: hypothetical protein ACKODX_12845 [Gemmata sp.]
MNTTRDTLNSAALTRRRPGKRVVLAALLALSAKTADHVRNLGWEVRTVADRDIRAAAAATEPNIVLLPEAAGDESGFLAGAKLLATLPHLKVIVLGANRTGTNERFAEFVGAEYATETDVSAVVDALV